MDPCFVHSLTLILIIISHIDIKSATKDNSINDTQMTTPGWRLEEYPNPVLDRVRCGNQGNAFFLCDPDGVLSSKEAKAVLKGMEKLCHGTKSMCYSENPNSCGGYSVVVVLVNRFYKTDSHSSEAKKWANAFRRRLLLNDGCGNNFLFVASKQDKEIAVSLGPKADEHLTNKPCLGKKLQSLKFKFQDHNIGQVLQAELRYLRKSLSGEMVCPEKHYDRHLGMPRGTIGMLVFVGLFVISFLSLLIYALVKKQQPGTQTLNTKTKCAHL